MIKSLEVQEIRYTSKKLKTNLYPTFPKKLIIKQVGKIYKNKASLSLLIALNDERLFFINTKNIIIKINDTNNIIKTIMILHHKMFVCQQLLQKYSLVRIFMDFHISF